MGRARLRVAVVISWRGAQNGGRFGGGGGVRSKSVCDQLSAGVGDVTEHGHARSVGNLRRCQNDVPHWSVGNRGKRPKGAEKKKLVGQDYRRSPVEHALNEKIHAPGERVEGLAGAHLETNEGREQSHERACVDTAIVHVDDIEQM